MQDARDMSESATERHTALIKRSLRAIDRLCTVGRTPDAGAAVETQIMADDGQP